MLNQGSIWRKWDLHIHTPASVLYNGFGSDWDTYVQKLFRSLIEKEIAVVGITDYFNIDGYKRVKQDYLNNEAKLKELFSAEEILKIKEILVLPNIEFRSNVFVGENSINFHIIFSEEVSIKDIEEKFLHEIDFRYEADPQQPDSLRKLSEVNLVELGQRLKSEHAKFQSDDDIFVGMMNAVFDDHQITTILSSKESTFGSKYVFVVMADEDLSNIDWDSRDHLTRKILTQKSDLLFTSNKNTKTWALGKNPYKEGPEKFIKEFKTLKPCIHGSDAHEYKFIGHPCAKRSDPTHNCETDPNACELRYCWVKGDTTFEGLRQLIYEPEDRVVIGQVNPTPIKSNYTIKSVKISKCIIDSELAMKETEVELNSSLVSVTGGKGSGKTAFVDLIANCYKNRCQTEDKNSFVGRISDSNPDLEITLTFSDGENTTFTKKVNDNNFFQNSEIVYIAQGELETYIGDNSDLDNYVNNLIFESPVINNTVKSFEFDQLRVAIDLDKKALESKNVLISKLESSTNEDALKQVSTEKKQLEADKKDIAARIIDSAKKQTEANNLTAQKSQLAISTLKERREALLDIQKNIHDAYFFVDNDLVIFNSRIELINSILTKLEKSDLKLDQIKYSSVDNLNKLNYIIQGELNSVVQEIEKSQKEIDQLATGIKDHAKLLDKEKDIDQAIERSEKKDVELKRNQGLLKIEIENRELTFKRLLKNTILLKEKYNEIISIFSQKKDYVLSDLSFGVKINYNQDDFINGVEEVLDQRRKGVKVSDTSTTFTKLFTLIEAYIIGGEETIDPLFDEIVYIEKENQSKIRNSQTINKTDFYNLFYKSYFSVAPVVRYKNIQLHKLSLGQKATVLIKIYLAQGDKPIIIDSHDDHLDNEFIMDELVKAIRQAKQYRQIILASNNGNVVINSDSEQIIIANRDKSDGEISYMAGAIENPDIYKRAIKILEGGPEAFKQRKQKYRISD